MPRKKKEKKEEEPLEENETEIIEENPEEAKVKEEYTKENEENEEEYEEVEEDEEIEDDNQNNENNEENEVLDDDNEISDEMFELKEEETKSNGKIEIAYDTNKKEGETASLDKSLKLYNNNYNIKKPKYLGRIRTLFFLGETPLFVLAESGNYIIKI